MTKVKPMQGGTGQDVASPGAIRIRGLTRSFGDVTALAALDLDIEAGAITGLLGPNGSGKSTLMRCLVGLVRADAGEAWVDGVPLRGDGCEVRARCTFAPGELSLYGRMRAEDHLDWLVDGHDKEARERAHAIALEFDLPLRKRLHTYSHGMKRQLLFSAVMGPRVPVRLLDEISEGLDPSKRGQILEKVREDACEGTTILLSSHHLGEVQRLCDRMIFMRAGHKLSDENSAVILSRARKIVRLRLDPDGDLERLKSVALQNGAITVSGDAQQLVLHLDDEDPRRTMAALFSDSSLPRPLRVEYGEMPLEELYRDLYGEDAC